MEKITLTITEEDGSLFRALRNHPDLDAAKKWLSNALDLYGTCVDFESPMRANLTPESFYMKIVHDKSDDELREMKRQFQEKILEVASLLDPDCFDCGIQENDLGTYWFVADDGILGKIALYNCYIREIDRLLDTPPEARL